MKIALTVLTFSAIVFATASSATGLPDDVRDMALRASALFEQQRYEEAAGLYRVIIQQHPDCLYGWSNLGVVRFQQGRYKEARNAMAHAAALAPNDAASLFSLGLAEFMTDDFAAAVKHLQASVALEPDNYFAHQTLSQSLEALGRHQEAAQEAEIGHKLRVKQGLKYQRDDLDPSDKTLHSS
jgi:tetratricopeptide (TPR) repeat protein